MARSIADIKADIALTRTRIEQDLGAIRSGLAQRRWAPFALVGGAVVVGALLARMPVLRLAGAGVRVARAGLGAAATIAAIGRLLRRGAS